MSKAIILSRVSTLNQDLKQQTDEVVKFAKADGYSGDNVEVIEDKESGVKLSEEHRLGLIELKQKILKWLINGLMIREIKLYFFVDLFL